MLLEFSVGNYLSFKNKVRFSMLATSISEHSETHIFKSGKHKLLKSSAIYGANSSGKSNLIKAMRFMRNFVLISSKESQIGEPIDVIPFLLNTITLKKPSFFEIIFKIDKKTYRYGFEVDKIRIHSEWLFESGANKEYELFTRLKNEIALSKKFKEGKRLESKTRNNALFLSVVAQFNGEISSKIIHWFNHFKVMSGLEDFGFMSFTIDEIQKEQKRKIINQFLKTFDLGFNSILPEIHDVDDISLNGKLLINRNDNTKEHKIIAQRIDLITWHSVFNSKKIKVKEQSFSLAEQESDGTKKIIAMSAPLLDTLENSNVLIIDELDTRMHPILTKRIIELFNSNTINNKNAQLIFATHDTNLLSKKIFRRDQIWFTEKDKFGATDLYSLAEFKLNKNKKVRKDATYRKDYLLGKYGAIPFIGDFNSLIG